MRTSVLILGLASLVLVACGSRGGLHDVRLKPGDGPDEFNITTQKPLATPENYSSLPTPGAAGNRADFDARQQAITALGGRQSSAGVSASDRALIAQSGRYGIDASIRSTLEAEDEKFRSRRVHLPSIRRGSKYFSVYSSMSLNARQELERLRASGVRTPTAPPR